MNLVDELKKASYVIPNEKEQDSLTVINLSEAIEIANRHEVLVMPKIADAKNIILEEITNRLIEKERAIVERDGAIYMAHLPEDMKELHLLRAKLSNFSA